MTCILSEIEEGKQVGPFPGIFAITRMNEQDEEVPVFIVQTKDAFDPSEMPTKMAAALEITRGPTRRYVCMIPHDQTRAETLEDLMKAYGPTMP